MGGASFASQMGKECFPRMPPKVYEAIKARYLEKISDLYTFIAVPIEAPEKTSYGDLDILVAVPKSSPKSTTSAGSEAAAAFVPHEIVRAALGARFVIDQEGNRTSNYAVPVTMGEWSAWGHQTDEAAARDAAPNGEIFYQVDVHPCEDEHEFERIKFFHSYGDMGMILGLMAANIGLKLGQTGLKIPDPPNPHFVLSVDFDDIMDFLGLSREVYNSGFKTRMEVYEWVCTMKWFDPYMPTGQGIAKLKPDRTMYAEFVLFVTNNWSISESERIRKRDDKKSRDALFQTAKLEALNYFDKTAQFETRLESRRIQQRTQAVFSGHRVRDWAELGEHWKGVKMIMDKIREMLGGERKVLEFYDSNGEDALRALVVAVRDDLGIYRRAT